MAKKVMKKLKEEVERTGKASNCQSRKMGRKEGKSKMIASCGFLEDELRQCSKEEGVTMAESVETLGVDLRTRVKKLGAKEQARRKKCKLRFSIIKKNEAFQKNYMKVGVKKLSTSGHGTSKNLGSSCSGDSSNGKILIEETDGSSSGRKRVRPLCPCSWKHVALKWRRNFLPWPLSTGQKESGRENGIMSKEKLG